MIFQTIVSHNDKKKKYIQPPVFSSRLRHIFPIYTPPAMLASRVKKKKEKTRQQYTTTRRQKAVVITRSTVFPLLKERERERRRLACENIRGSSDATSNASSVSQALGFDRASSHFYSYVKIILYARRFFIVIYISNIEGESFLIHII